MLRQRASTASTSGKARVAAEHGQDQRLGRRVEAPGDAILDLLRRVRLGEDLGEEELEKAAIVAEPVVPVVLRPALVFVELVVEPEGFALRRRRREERHRRTDQEDAVDALRMTGGEKQRAQAAHRHARHARGLDARRIEDGDRVGDELPSVVRRRFPRPVREAVAATVEGDDPEVPREVRDLRLPVARVDDRPRGQKQDGPPPRTVGLPVDADAVPLDDALLVR